MTCQGAYRLPDPLADLEVRRCRIEMCQNPEQTSRGRRPRARNVKLVRCHVTASELGPVFAEDCLVDTLWLHRGMWGPQRLAGSVFRHMTIRGSISGGLRFIAAWDWLLDSRIRLCDTDEARANADFYAGVDWALDISAAEFSSVELTESGIPACLIRRDPDTQVVVDRKAAMEALRRRLELPDPAWLVGLERLVESGFDDTVLVAAKRGRRFAQQLASIALLRDEGLTMPD